MEDIYSKVKDMLSRDTFMKLIEKEKETYGYLIDDVTAALLVVDKFGRNFFTTKKIEEIEVSTEVTLYVKIDKIGEVKETKKGKVVDIVISDDTGSCILVLWDANTELVNHKKLYEGCVVKIINGYVKEGYYGLEINVGKWGAIEIESKVMNIKVNKWRKLNEVKKGIANIEGKILQINPTKIFFTENGERFLTKIIMEDESGEREIMVWDEMVKEIQGLLGRKIKILNVYVKNGTMHAGRISKIVPNSHTNL